MSLSSVWQNVKTGPSLELALRKKFMGILDEVCWLHLVQKLFLFQLRIIEFD